MLLKSLFSLVLFFAINHGLWDYLVLTHNVSPQWASFYVYLILAVIIAFLYKNRILESFHTMKDKLTEPPFLLKKICLPMLIGYIGTILISNLMGFIFNVNILPQNTENIKQVQDTIPLVFTFLMMSAFAPLIEEAVFREALLGWVDKENRSLLFALATLSVILFAAMHVDLSNPNNIASVIYYFPLSIALAHIYLKNGSEVSTSIVAHAITNLFAFFFMLFELI